MKINESIIDSIVNHRRELHQIPELGFEELKTQKYLKEALTKLGYEPKEICKTGLYIYLEGESKECYSFRTDIDGLPIVEETSHDFKSSHHGKMHACGHDGHMATMLGFAEYLLDKKESLKKSLLLIFQPAEEGPGGAKDIVESGIFEKYNVKGVFGLHLFPKLEEGIIACRAGGFMAKAAEINIDITGKSGHGGQPQTGIDAIQVATRMLNSFNLITSKYIAPFTPAIIAFGKIEGGTVRNIISENCRLEGTIRAFSTENFNFIVKKIRDIAKGFEIAFDCKINIDIAEGYPPVINDPEYVEVLKNGINKHTDLNYLEIDPEMLAEDFGFYQEAMRGLFFFVGIRNEEKGFTNPLHSCHFNFEEKTLQNGLKAYISISKELEIF